ncbi:MAG: [FeFe] hydrogenase, group A [Candidatus Woesearchaeota archaeon]
MPKTKAKKIIVNGKEYFTKEKFLLKALEEFGFNIPHLCFHEDLEPLATCRLCVVEVNGKITTSCNTVVSEGMKVNTETEEVIEYRRHNLELILSNHALDCDYCYRNLHCDLQRIAEQITNKTRYSGKLRKHEVDESSNAIVKDFEKCILCGRCIQVCNKQSVNVFDYVQRGFSTIVSTALDIPISSSPCVGCGQCVIHCPTAALIEKDETQKVLDAIKDPEKIIIAQIAPAVRVSIGEELGLKPGTIMTKKLVSALKQIGFDKVFDTSLGADFTIMEEASELVDRINNNKTLPMLTSCCPAWVNFVEEFYPDFILNLSTTKSPHEILGALIKTYYAKKNNINTDKIFVVSIMPCTAKKLEVLRPELRVNNLLPIDAVLTTREIGKLLREFGVELKKIEEQDFDDFMSASSAGQIFGTTGGVMEAALRTASFILTGINDESKIEYKEIRGIKGVKIASYTLGNKELRVGVVNELGNARKILEKIKSGRLKIDFLEVMACPGGCIGGGGQPLTTNKNIIKQRMKALYIIDKKSKIRFCHENPILKDIYLEFLERPLSEKSEELLHTKYFKQKQYKI